MFAPTELAEFSSGLAGGTSDWIVKVNQAYGTGGLAANPGEIAIQGTYYQHPDGTVYPLTAFDSANNGTITVITPFGEAVAIRDGRAFLMWTSTPIQTRIPAWSFPSAGVTANYVSLNIIPVILSSGVWSGVENDGTLRTLTIEDTDVLLAEFDSDPRGIHSFRSYVTDDGDLTNTLATLPSASNELVCQRTGFNVPVSEGLKKEWTGLLVREKSWEPRHPQDFVRARPERQRGSPAPEQQDRFIEDVYGTDGVTVDDLG